MCKILIVYSAQQLTGDQWIMGDGVLEQMIQFCEIYERINLFNFFNSVVYKMYYLIIHQAIV